MAVDAGAFAPKLNGPGRRLSRPAMMRAAAAATVWLPVLFMGTDVAAADEPLPEPSVTCNYNITAPQVVTVSGVSMVTVSVSSVGCQGLANPMLMVACVAVAAGDPDQCQQRNGVGTAQTYRPYRPGATYIATGKGCASVAIPPSSICSALGPISASL